MIRRWLPTRSAGRPFLDHETNPTHGLDQGGLAGRLKLFAQIPHIDVQQVVVTHPVFAPEGIEDAASLMHLVGLAGQMLEQVELSGGEVDRLPPPC